MTVNPYTMNSLYNKGIIDYVPYDLCNGPVVSGLNGMPNPYLANAMQGTLYQQYGNGYDRFYPTVSAVNNQIGSFSNAGVNSYGSSGIGLNGQAGINSFGIDGIGYQSQTGMTNSYGGFGDVQGHFNKISNTWGKIPKPVKGLLSLGVVIGSFALMLRGKKVPQVETKTSFFSKLNPINWFKKSKV